MDKFKGKYRIESNRLKGWNYSSDAKYFITLVTQNRECNLGNIVNGEMILSDIGKIIETEWLKSFEIRNELFLDEYIIMPNHLHAIVIIQNKEMEIGSHVPVDSDVETHGRASLQSQSQSPSFYRMPKSISSFVGGFKSAINSKIDDYIDKHNLTIPKYNRNNHFFQPNYHDHIIRNNQSYEKIKNYIINNPRNWDDDTFNDTTTPT
ncbi:MAG: transposase [Candidatus Paceibacterota bacterium]|jgi:REP element-mobilizing transposase RayT